MDKVLTGRSIAIAGLILALAGLIASSAFWWADRESHALSITVASKAALQTELPKHVPNTLEITFNGKKVADPYVSVITLRNVGTKPIPSRDFESGISVATGKARILQALVTRSNAHLKPKIGLNGGVLEISPMLLNPDDFVTFSIITVGDVPRFSAAARIAEIGSIEITDAGGESKSKLLLLTRVSGFCLLVFYAALALCIFPSNQYRLRGVTIVLGSITCGIGGLLLLSILEPSTLGGRGEITPMLLVVIPAILIAPLMIKSK